MYGDVLDRLSDRRLANLPDMEAAGRSDAQTSGRQDGGEPEQPRVKATFYLTRDDVLAIDRMQGVVFMETGKKPERSQLVSQAIQLMADQGKLG